MHITQTEMKQTVWNTWWYLQTLSLTLWNYTKDAAYRKIVPQRVPETDIHNRKTAVVTVIHDECHGRIWIPLLSRLKFEIIHCEVVFSPDMDMGPMDITQPVGTAYVVPPSHFDHGTHFIVDILNVLSGQIRRVVCTEAIGHDAALESLWKAGQKLELVDSSTSSVDDAITAVVANDNMEESATDVGNDDDDDDADADVVPVV